MSGSVAAVPPRSFRSAWWGLALLLDAILLVFLPYVGWIALLVGSTLVLTWLVREPERALAFAALGQPLVSAVGYMAGVRLSMGLAEPFLILAPLGLRVWYELWAWPHLPRRRVQGAESTDGRVLLLCTALLAVVLGVGLFWTPSPGYGRMKLILFTIRNGLFLFGAWQLLQATKLGTFAEKGVSLLRSLLGFALVLAALSLWNQLAEFWPTGNRLSVADLNPIWFARFLGVGILAGLSLVAMRRMSVPAAALAVVSLAVPFYLAGSRGPLLALLIAGCFFLLSGPTWNSPFRKLLLVAVPAVSLLLVGLSITQGVLGDWSPFSSHSASNVAREMMFRVALDWIYRPGWFGLGTGAYSSLVGVGDIRFYPHNIFIEIWLENGVLGLVALGGFCFATVRVWKRARRQAVLLGSTERELVRFAATWFVFSFVNAQFSGDIVANEHLFLAAGTLLAWSRSIEPGLRSRSPRPRPMRLA